MTVGFGEGKTNSERGQGSSEDPLGPYPMASCASKQKQGCRGEVGATGATKRGASRGETKEPGDAQVGPLCQCPSVQTSHPNSHCESRKRREKRVGATRSGVKEVSLAEQDASLRGLDLPNWASQVIR